MSVDVETIVKQSIQFPDDFFQDEIREGFFIERKMKCAWAAQMEVLKEIDRICGKYDIKYFADSGTLLGAVRHKGFIPWDDDLDIAMVRDEYQRFLEIAAKELPKEWMLLNWSTGGHQLFARITNGDTYDSRAERLLRFHGCPYVVGVDIFPIDYVPPQKEEEEVWHLLLRYIHGVTIAAEKSTAEELGEELQKIEELSKIEIDRKGNIKQQLMRVSDQIARLYHSDEANELEMVVCDVGRKRKYKYKREWYADSIQVPFENITVPIPIGYEGVLTSLFGADYMTPIRDAAGHDYPFYKKQDMELEKMRKMKERNR